MKFESIYTVKYLIDYSESLKFIRSRDKILIMCDYCQSLTYRIVKNVKRHIKNGSTNSFCTRECQALYNTQVEEIPCTNCSAMLSRKPTGNNIFCNRSCAATYNNKITPKRTVEGSCKNCNGPIRSSRNYCKLCHTMLFKVDWNNTTYGEVKGQRKYQRNSRIRSLARATYLSSDRPQKCHNCSYNKHFEVCHIKAICDHDDNDLVSTINNPNNLIALCPNCHWELDYGDLTIDDIL